jgi:hypothetical protein
MDRNLPWIAALITLNFALGCAVSRVWANQEGSKLNGTHYLTVYADDFNILDGRIHIITKNRSFSCR